jgi:hypothetical protein
MSHVVCKYRMLSDAFSGASLTKQFLCVNAPIKTLDLFLNTAHMRGAHHDGRYCYLICW